MYVGFQKNNIISVFYIYVCFFIHKQLVKCITFHISLIHISKATASYLQYLNPKGEELYKQFASVPILFTMYCSHNIYCTDRIEINMFKRKKKKKKKKRTTCTEF